MPPLYEYECLKCHKVVTVSRSMARRNDALVCSDPCRGPMQHILSPTPGVVKKPAAGNRRGQ